MHVFISYAHEDRTYVARLTAHLTRAGVPVWADHTLKTGDRFVDHIEAAIENCAAFISVISVDSRHSDWVKDELAYARARGKPILPLRLSGSPSIELGRYVYEDVRGGRYPSNGFVQQLISMTTTDRRTDASTPPMMPTPPPTQTQTPSPPPTTAPLSTVHMVPSRPGLAVSKSMRVNVAIAVVTIALIAVGAAIYFGLKLLPTTSGPSATGFVVGACVRQDGAEAVVVDCATPGAYRITTIVDAENGCPDANQPHIVLATGSLRYACLSPAN